MKKPKLTPQQARQFKRDLDTKDKIVAEMSRAMSQVLKGAVNEVYARFQKTGKLKLPNLDGMLDVNIEFYRKVVSAAVQSCKSQAVKKRLASLPEGDLPDGKEALNQVFRNKKYWQKIMARAKKLTDRQKRAYLDNLKKHFRDVIPLLDESTLSPRQIKNKIAEAWKAPVARAETIFRTETTKYFTNAQVAYYADSSEIIGFMFDSVRDTSRTPICKCREGLIFRPGSKELATNMPPLHYNCRSHLIPLVNDAENRELLKNSALDPANKKLLPPMPGFGT